MPYSVVVPSNLAPASFDARELVDVVHLRADVLSRRERHHDELAVLCRVEHTAEVAIVLGQGLDVLREALLFTCHLLLVLSVLALASSSGGHVRRSNLRGA